jgi:hypothetical protein
MRGNSGRLLGIVSISVLCALPAFAQQTFEELSGEKSVAECKLNNCLNIEFPAAYTAAKQSSDIISSYVNQVRKRLDDLSRTANHDTESALDFQAYKLEVINRKLSECQDLANGPGVPRHIILIGKSLTRDGRSFDLAAATRFKELVTQYCSNRQGVELEDCKKTIVIKEGLTKDEMREYLNTLGPESVESVAYFGHGFEDGIMLGPKNLLLPKDWDESLKISKQDWMQRNQGMIYTKDMGGLGKDFSRVLKADAKVSFNACNAGREFGQEVKQYLGDRQVMACDVPMHFVVRKKGSQVIEKSGPGISEDLIDDMYLEPDVPGHFKEISQFSGIRMQDNTRTTPRIRHDYTKPKNPTDRAAQDIALRVVLGSADKAIIGPATTGTDSSEVIMFTPEEQKMLKQAMGPRVLHESVYSSAFGFDSLKTTILTSGSSSPRDASRLVSKLEACVKEAVRLFYSPSLTEPLANNFNNSGKN